MKHYRSITFSCLSILLMFIFQSCSHVIPDVETEPVVSQITKNSAIVKGTVINNGGLEIVERGICYGTTINPIERKEASTGGMGGFQVTLTELSPDTDYFVRAYAVNDVGIGYGDNQTFQTLPQENTPDVRTISYDQVTSNSAVIQGNVVSDGGSAVTTRGVCWSTSQNPTISVNYTTEGSGTGSYTSSVTNLSPGTKYYVRAYATNSEGTAYGNELYFTTIAVKPTVTTALVLNITENSASSGGNVTYDGGAAVTARGVCWSTSQNPTIADHPTTDGSGTGSFTSTINGLTCEKTYYLRAYATNSAGTAYGSQRGFTTGECTTVTDVDGNIYQIVKIGNQTWMAENLKVTHYEDGTSIPLNTEWEVFDGDKAYCYYDNQSSNGDTYGALYTWWAAMNDEASTDANPSGVQGVCPDGWHMPSDSEWKELEMYLGMSQSEADIGHNPRGTDEGGKLKETGFSHWTSPNTGATNSSGFTALPGGSANGGFLFLGTDANFWTATEGSTYDAWHRHLFHDNPLVEREYGRTSKHWGFSVRCVKN